MLLKKPITLPQLCIRYSCAILRYLCNKYSLEDHWYPKDIQARSKVEEALDWFPGNLRCGAFRFIVSAASLVWARDKEFKNK